MFHQLSRLLLNSFSSLTSWILCLWWNSLSLSYKCAEFHERNNKVMSQFEIFCSDSNDVWKFVIWISLIKEKSRTPLTSHSTKENRDVEEWNQLSNGNWHHASNEYKRSDVSKGGWLIYSKLYLLKLYNGNITGSMTFRSCRFRPFSRLLGLNAPGHESSDLSHSVA